MAKDFVYSQSFLLKMKDSGVAKACPEELENMKIEHIHFKQTTNSLPPDIKRIVGIFNKLSENNCMALLEETKTFNYVDDKVVTIIFSKILNEPIFSEPYAKFCTNLVDLHELINNRCLEEFRKTYHKNAGKFIAELYKLKVLKNLDIIIDDLLDNITEVKLESLCKIISTVGSKEKIFKDTLIKLDSIKSNFSPRYKFMIMDLIENKTK